MSAINSSAEELVGGGEEQVEFGAAPPVAATALHPFFMKTSDKSTLFMRLFYYERNTASLTGPR
jgi:hypothetical protein